MQETLLKAVASKSELQNPQYLDTWLFRILINSWHDYLNRSRRCSINTTISSDIKLFHSDQVVEELISKRIEAGWVYIKA